MLLLPTTIQAKQRRKWRRRSLDDFSREIDAIFTQHLSSENMLAMSRNICLQLNENAKASDISMLPSFTHTLPTGTETGTYLALDVGGSTLRISLIQLNGKAGAMQSRLTKSVFISEEVKRLKGKEFFAWMAENIDDALSSDDRRYGYGKEPLLTGLSWSFPLEQTSVGGARILPMGKGFLCSEGTTGLDLGELISEACSKRSLNIKMAALVNDSSATLLSKAYTVPSTRMSLIVGTGTNAAILFPVHAIGHDKFGQRDAEWFAEAKRVIVNTELSMYGGNNILMRSRWDELLNREHIKPDFQPLEYMTTGRYLGEIVRLIIVEAVKTAGLFGGTLPSSMEKPYSFDTAIVSCIEADKTAALTTSSGFLQKLHSFPEPPTPMDMMFLKSVCISVSRRAAAYLATAVFSLWAVCNEHERSIRTANDSPSEPPSISIACDGAVILKYPGFREQCQAYLDQLVVSASGEETVITGNTYTASSVKPVSNITLDIATDDSTIYGAAVAVAVAVADQKSNLR
ncbi:hypothetical protein KEM56_001682 [Ascosphaera pollenicola]|nr:hypothetical protein KEM56_001682 [Ascosphaera pollenicola]